MKPTLPLFKLTAVAGLTLFAVTDIYAARVASGSDQDALLKGAVRYRNLSSANTGMGMNQTNPKEIYIGKVPLSTTNNRAEGDVTGGMGKAIVLSYNPATQILSTTVGTVTVSKNVGALDTLNYILLNVQNNSSTSGGGMSGGGMGGGSTPPTVALNDVKLNGIALVPASFVGAANGAKWNVTGEDLSQGFIL